MPLITRLTRLCHISVMMLIAIVTTDTCAQETPYKYNIGARLGMSGYVGEASSNLFSHPGFCASGEFNYQYDSRWVFGGSLGFQTLSGSTADMDNVLPGGAVYDFKSSVVDLAGYAEFNFFSFGIGETYKKLKRWTPYLKLGVGVAMATSDGSTAWAPTIPMGVGIKYKVSERFNLNAEFLAVKAFSDHIDGPLLSDLQLIKSSFVKNNDWYSRISIGFTYEFSRRCETCHYVD
ncbi:MAG: outer membrane beta-barrel protein [Muribaculaceae bacterium]|nr:outer membrane beta-barrel protein [Muribaculaceae bacterium]